MVEKVKKYIHYTRKGSLFLFGVIFLLLGLVGLLAPIVPDLSFLIIAITLFAKSSDSFDEWLENKDLKKYLDISYLYNALKRFLSKPKISWRES